DDAVALYQHSFDCLRVVTRMVRMADVLQFAGILAEIMVCHVTARIELFHCRWQVVILWPELSCEHGAAVHDRPEKGALAQIGGSVLAPDRLDLRVSPCLLAVRPGDTHFGDLLQRTADGPVLVQLVESIPADQRPVPRTAGAPARAIGTRVQNGRPGAPPLEMRKSEERRVGDGGRR